MLKNIVQNNHVFIKRDDLIPLSFGGNKARKAAYFFDEIDNGDYNCVVTYGSSSSNHCRIISNIAASKNIPCYIISPEEASETTFNSVMMNMFDAKISAVPVTEVHNTIKSILEELAKNGMKPYFIPGGGHGNLGTQAYVDCYEEIVNYEKENSIFFDYIFLASGTGTTQAGLVCGQLLHNDDRKIIGISIARKKPRGRQVVLESIRDYLDNSTTSEKIDEYTIFIDDYICEGYAHEGKDINETIKEVLIRYGIPMDSTYTGKAFSGMKKYIEQKTIKDKNILFIHTGGTPLFFDYLKGI